MTYAAYTSFPIRDLSAILDIFGSASRSLNSLRHRSNLSCGSRSRSRHVSISQPKTIISLLRVPSSSSLFSESVSFVRTGSSFASGFINAYIASETKAVFFLIMDRQSTKQTLIMSFKKQSPRPNDVVGTLIAITLVGAIEMSGCIYTAVGTLGCIGLNKMSSVFNPPMHTPDDENFVQKNWFLKAIEVVAKTNTPTPKPAPLKFPTEAASVAHKTQFERDTGNDFASIVDNNKDTSFSYSSEF